MDTIVLTTWSRWDEPPRIRHQVARQLSRFYRVIFVEIPILTRDAQTPESVVEVAPNLFRCRLTKPAAIPFKAELYLPPVQHWIQRGYLSQIKVILEEMDVNRVVLCNFNYDLAGLMEAELFDLKIYFCNDDFPAATSEPLARMMMTRQERKVCELADLCLGVSHPLVEKLSLYNRNTKLLLPGHEWHVPETVSAKRDPNRPIKACFMGYINRRVEMRWLALAAADPDIDVHLVGPIQTGEYGAELSAIGDNMTLHDSLYDDELRDFLGTMDVLLIPYDITVKKVRAITASNKFYQYLSVGKPTVISDMPHFIEMPPGVLYRASDQESFVEMIKTAACEDSLELQQTRLRIARENSWDIRGDWIHDLIDSHLQDRSQPVKTLGGLK